jgi:inner membrane protein
MTAKGHIALAFPISIIGYHASVYDLGLQINFLHILLYLSVAHFFSLVPDIDESGSTIGRLFPILSHAVDLLFRHRGPTHWLIMPTSIYLLSFTQEGAEYAFILHAIAIGWLAHILGDLLTTSGIKGLFFPFFPNTRIKLPYFLSFTTGGVIESIVVFSLTLFNIYILFYEITGNSFISHLFI